MVSSNFLVLQIIHAEQRRNEMSNAIVWFDISKLDLSISLLIDKTHHQAKINNNQEGFNFFSKWLKKHRVTKVTAFIEATGKHGTFLLIFHMTIIIR